jgi:chromosome segregation ATPase
MEEHSMKVKVNFKKPTVMLTADKYSSMLEEMASLRSIVARKDAEVIERNALIQELNDQIEASETARKDAEDALVIAKKNETLREMGWDMLHKQIEELQRENRGLRVDLSNARKLNEELSDQVEADEREIADLKASKEILQEFREEMGQEIDEANRVIAEMATELTELKADRNIALAEIERLKGEVAQKDKINDTSFKATNELAELLVAAQRERDEAREEAGNYRVELMERDCRVAELEKQVEWLRDKNEEWAQVANDQKATIVNYEAVIESLREEVERWKRIAAENVDMAKQFHHEALRAEADAKRFKEAFDDLYEQFADNHSNAEYWEDQARKLEEEIDTLRRQLKANEETYMALRAMYEELRDAASGLVSHIRTNTFAN